jgi:hypothetical protein
MTTSLRVVVRSHYKIKYAILCVSSASIVNRRPNLNSILKTFKNCYPFRYVCTYELRNIYVARKSRNAQLRIDRTIITRVKSEQHLKVELNPTVPYNFNNTARNLMFKADRSSERQKVIFLMYALLKNNYHQNSA